MKARNKPKGEGVMPWESKTVEEIRREFVVEAQNCINFSALCRKYGITRKTGYKWLERFEQGECMADRNRAPQHKPTKTPKEIEEKILQLRAENPGWGAKTLKAVLEAQGNTQIPCAKTVNNILNRYGCISEEESQKRRAYIRFEKEQCNKMWQTDFKGEFMMNNGKYCYPLDIIDDHSRFLLQISPAESTANIVMPCFEKAFQEYGVPDSILSDNGAQFAGFRHGYTQFEKWLMNLDVLPVHGRIKHPQTQGKIERFHRTLKNELLKYTTFTDIKNADEQLQKWRYKYNYIRPHEALGMKCPADVYVPSNRSYSGIIKPYEYSGDFRVIKINSWGYARFNNWQIYLSETMINEFVEFRPNPLGDCFDVCYRNFKIASFDIETGKLINRLISRL